MTPKSSAATRLCLLLAACTGVASCSHLPVTDRLRAWRYHQALATASPFRDLAWRSVGPRLQGGRIEAIARPAGRTRVIYVGAGSGNLWKSEDDGASWQPIFDDQSSFAIGDVAVAPSDPNTVWVGTGERLMARSSYAGTGVFKSIDAGRSWQNMGLCDSHHIGKVVVHPTDADTVYVAAIGHMFTYNEERGLFKTTDGGRTWQRVLYLDEKTAVIDMVMDPRDPDTIYATSWERDRKAWGHVAHGANSAIHKTTDGGRTWVRLRGGFPNGPAVGRIGIAIAATAPDTVYAIVDGQGETGGVYRSNDAGATWAKVNRTRVPAGYDFCMIRVAPDNAEEVWVPGQRNWRSTDGGRTFRQVSGTLQHVLPHGSSFLHLDTHAFVFDPQDPDHILLGNDGGVHVSRDRGRSWLHLNTLPIGEFYAVSYDMATPFNIYGGTQDNAALFGPSDQPATPGSPESWRHVYLDPWGGGDSYFTFVDPENPNTIYYEHQFGMLRRKDMTTGKTKDIRPRARGEDPPLRFNWMSPFCLSHFDPKTLYFGTQFVHRSTDRGETWQRISGDLTSQPGPERTGNVPFGTITMLSESKLERGVLYAGTDDGRLHVTRDGGVTWTRIDAGLPEKWVSRVVASVHEVGTVYVTLTGYREDDITPYVYRSTDFGRSWQAITGNLPDEAVNVIGEDPADPHILVVGTDLGCYVSIDGGRRWASLCHTLPTTPVHDLFIHPRDPVLVIGTHGRSVFTLDVGPIRARRRGR